MTVALDLINVSQQNDVLVLEIDRAQRLNALDMHMFDSLALALESGDRDPGVGALMLCGSGGSFCAGHDLQAFERWPQSATDPVPRFLHGLAALTKPLVVAVHGWAVGIGATCLLHADWVLAVPAAQLKFPFVDIGIAPEAGSSLLLARAVGSLRARQLLLTGDAISAEQAHAWGLVSEICDENALRTKAMERAVSLARKPAGSTARIKSLFTSAAEVHARIDLEIDLINQAVLERRSREQAPS